MFVERVRAEARGRTRLVVPFKTLYQTSAEPYAKPLQKMMGNDRSRIGRYITERRRRAQDRQRRSTGEDGATKHALLTSDIIVPYRPW